MTERPILFQGAMVRALLAGTKTQTRRVVKPQPWILAGELLCWKDDALTPEEMAQRCPCGVPGDRLWVRESHWWFRDEHDPETGYFPPKVTADDVEYRADGEKPGRIWRPSIHMHRWASRILLEVTAVRVERLWSISRGDAMAEGCPFPNMAKGDDPRKWYYDLWEQINGHGSWAVNPWVWVVEFRRIQT